MIMDVDVTWKGTPAQIRKTIEELLECFYADRPDAEVRIGMTLPKQDDRE